MDLILYALTNTNFYNCNNRDQNFLRDTPTIDTINIITHKDVMMKRISLKKKKVISQQNHIKTQLNLQF